MNVKLLAGVGAASLIMFGAIDEAVDLTCLMAGCDWLCGRVTFVHRLRFWAPPFRRHWWFDVLVLLKETG